MTAATQTLADWLLERIAEDARVGHESWTEADEFENPASPTVAAVKGFATRWLAECEAKRRIVEYADGAVREGQRLYHDGYDAESGAADACEAVLRLLALPYADRPGYRQEWAP